MREMPTKDPFSPSLAVPCARDPQNLVYQFCGLFAFHFCMHSVVVMVVCYYQNRGPHTAQYCTEA